jgi:hypothetical protein
MHPTVRATTGADVTATIIRVQSFEITYPKSDSATENVTNLLGRGGAIE